MQRDAPRDLRAEPAYPGLLTVAFSLRHPDWTAHRRTAKCPREEPHPVAACPLWQRVKV